MSARRAVLIASSKFGEGSGFQDLRSPEHDVDRLQSVLDGVRHGGFSRVDVLKNQPRHLVEEAVNTVLLGADKNDLVLIYYSGHGKLNRSGRLHLAMTNSRVELLESTALPFQHLKSYIETSPTNRVVVVLDCCYSGAAGKEFKGTVDEELQQSAHGRGTYILTASSGFQIAEGGEDGSVFTRHLIEGIESGDADENGNGEITVEELYNYANKRVRAEGGQQPMRWAADAHGELVIARSGRDSRRERRDKYLPKLLELLAAGNLDNRIASPALIALEKSAAELKPTERALDDLIEAFFDGRIGLGKFNTEAVAAITRAAAKPPKPDPPEVNAPERVPPPTDHPRSEPDVVRPLKRAYAIRLILFHAACFGLLASFAEFRRDFGLGKEEATASGGFVWMALGVAVLLWLRRRLTIPGLILAGIGTAIGAVFFVGPLFF